MINNAALTANGNRYEKGNTAKKAGLGAGATIGVASGIIGKLDKFKTSECVVGGLAIGAGAGLIGLAAGWIIDRF